MKKRIFLVSALVAMAMSVMFVACKDKNEAEDSKDSKDMQGCKCTFYLDGEKYDTIKFDLDNMEDEWEASTCPKLEKALDIYFNYYGDYYEIKCKEY